MVVIKPSRVSVGECDSMSRRSGSVETLSDESCLSPTSRWHAVVGASGSEPNEYSSHDPANARAGPLILEHGLPLGIHALQELTSLCRRSIGSFSPPCVAVLVVRQARL